MRHLLILLISILLTCCSKSFIQIFDTASTNTQLSDDLFVYENDTVKIAYSFWANKGVMSFLVYNKLDRPIYIDWKNSSFIYNDNKLNYWVDETSTVFLSYYGSYYYNGPLLKPGFAISDGVQVGRASTIKPERITSIPPRSNYYRSQFYLLPVESFKIDLKCKCTVVPRNDNPKKKTLLYREDFTLANTPLRIRNYLAISLTENSQQFYFVDNEFYLTSVQEMDYRHYRGKHLGPDEKGNPLYAKSFKRPTSFFIKIPTAKSIEYRRPISNKTK